MEPIITDRISDFLEAVADPGARSRVKVEDLNIQSRLGGGVESDVLKGTWNGIGVAVKSFKYKVPPEGPPDGTTTETNMLNMNAFANEVSMLMSLRHRNIIQLLGFGNKPPRQILVTEFMERGSLFHVLGDTSVTLDGELKKSLLLQCARGIGFLHRCRPKIIHKDLKSLNLLVDKAWNLKVSDFGISKDIRDEGLSQSTEFHDGTLQWLAPELLLDCGGERESPKIDVFAFGVILWEVASRCRPWLGNSASVIRESVVSGKRLVIDQLNWSSSFVNLMSDCWAQEPRKRPTFAKIIRELGKTTVL